MIARILVWMIALLHHEPTAPQRELAVAIAEAPALFAGSDGAEHTAAFLTAIAWRESAFTLSAVGDSGRSMCAFQILGGPRSLLTDARACTMAAHAILVRSIAMCPAYPLAPYARGTCASVDGRRISADRMRIANQLLVMP